MLASNIKKARELFNNVGFDKFIEIKEEVFNQWVTHYKIDENNIPRLDGHKLKDLFKTGQYNVSDSQCWFALHYWHPQPGDEFVNRKLLLLVGKQWDDKLYRIAEIFAYLPLTLPKIAFNPKETRTIALKLAADDSRLGNLIEKKDTNERQGIIIVTDETLDHENCVYLKELGISIKNCDFLPRIKNGTPMQCKKNNSAKSNGHNNDNDLCTFFKDILNKQHSSSYLRLVSSNKYLDILSKQLNVITENFRDYNDAECDKETKCRPRGTLNNSCATKCIAHQIHENVNAHLLKKGAAFLLQSFFTWDWKYMYMFPGALWDTVIGGVGCSFKKPLTDYEFQCMRILVRDMLTPYTILEKRMVELSEEKEQYFKKLEKGRNITAETIVSAYKMSQEISKLSRDYLSVTDTSLTEEIWSLFKEKALCLISHDSDSKLDVVNKYKDNTIKKLVETAAQEIGSIMFPEYTKDILSICKLLEDEAKKVNILDNRYDKKDKKQKPIFALCETYKIENYKINLKTVLDTYITNIPYGDYLLLVHDNNFFSNQLKALLNPTSGIKKIDKAEVVIEKEYKLKHLIILFIQATCTEGVFNPSGNLRESLEFLKDYCYMGYIKSYNESFNYEKKPLSNKETEKIYNEYFNQNLDSSINIMFCFSRGVDNG